MGAQRECPAGSIYGHVRATSPLLDYTPWKARSTCAPPTTSCPTPCSPCAARLPADRDRGGGIAPALASSKSFTRSSYPSPSSK